MRKMVIGMATAAAMSVFGAYGMSLADANAQIGAAADDAAVMADVVSQLAPADQVTFLASVNAAISKMGASAEEKAAKFLSANEAAVKAASRENKAAMIAETFATVPPEALTVINERFAEDLLNRSANPDRRVSDQDFLDVATNLMAMVQQRNEGNGAAGVRDTFAALMLLRASGESDSPDMREALLGGIPDAESRELATTQWVPAALGDNGATPTYDTMLGASDADTAPDTGRTLSLVDATPMANSSLFADLGGGTEGGGEDSTAFTKATGLGGGDGTTPAIGGGSTIPHTLNPEAPFYNGYRRGSGFKGSNNAEGNGGDTPGPGPTPPPPPPYKGQLTY